MRLIFDCQDGYVLLFLLGGTMATIGEYKLVEWMEAEGKCPGWLKGFDWSKLDVANVEQKFFDDLSDAVAPFLLDKTKKQLFDWSMENELFLAPVNDIADLLENPQLRSREFWVELEHPELKDAFTYPGPFVKMSRTPVTVRRRAPLIGEHNVEIYRDELGIPQDRLISLNQAGVI
jgi:crotonobetainyl-CoA:carnitine CoA-transferase CaiB-like acyl-CoA transferase